jgi:CDP-glycerol glycerophosphotransferase
VTGRPILYYIYDHEEYEAERGLYFPVTDMPGYHCHDINQLCASLDRALVGEIPDPGHYAQSRTRYSSHDDGLATKRVVSFFFEDVQTYVVPAGKGGRKNILLNGGSLLPNGITTSFQNLVKHLDRRQYNVVLGFSPTAIEADPSAMMMFRKLSHDISAVPRYGNVPMSPEEYWVRGQYEACREEPSEEQVSIVRNVFEREFTRIFGPAEFEALVSFSGYDAFWGSILTMNRRDSRKAIYLHNDMYGEYVAKFPELERMFRLYRHADALISVSRQTSDLNRKNISGRFNLDPHKFVSCDNLLDPEGMLNLSRETLNGSDGALFQTDAPVFINIGRLSVEKGHEKLLHAFAGFVKGHPYARLLILGSGPLRQHLEQVILTLELTSNVFLLGYRSNPYPFLAAADCFVLSSNHEGQPMTLLEALVLNKPIVATDIVGNRSVLQGRSGLLVENSIDGLLRGMRSFAQGAVPADTFDWKAYQREALSQFDRMVVGRAPVAPTTLGEKHMADGPGKLRPG